MKTVLLVVLISVLFIVPGCYNGNDDGYYLFFVDIDSGGIPRCGFSDVTASENLKDKLGSPTIEFNNASNLTVTWPKTGDTCKFSTNKVGDNDLYILIEATLEIRYKVKTGSSIILPDQIVFPGKYHNTITLPKV